MTACPPTIIHRALGRLSLIASTMETCREKYSRVITKLLYFKACFKISKSITTSWESSQTVRYGIVLYVLPSYNSKQKMSTVVQQIHKGGLYAIRKKEHAE
jgi:hypothetical protein